MKNFETLGKEARFLFEHVRTIWDNYDMHEKSEEPERRVPKIKFLSGVEVEWMVDEVSHERKDCFEVYVRECQVKYNGNIYIFELFTKIKKKRVMGYFLEVFTPEGDGKGGIHKLFTERI